MVDAKYCKEFMGIVNKLSIRELVILASAMAEARLERMGSIYNALSFDEYVSDIVRAYKECMDNIGEKNEV